jgi:imidazolonepropionase-like amidohydrolase
MRKNNPALILFLFGSLVFLPPTLESQVTAVKAGKIYPGGGAPFGPGVILIEEGRITAIGGNVEIPWNATVLDYGRNIVVPGLVEAHAARGYDLANETNPLTPFVTVLDALDPSHDAFETALRDGVTTLNVVPGNDAILAGIGALVKPAGLVVEDMLLLPVSGMKMSVSGTPAFSRMGATAQLRRYLNETRDYITGNADERAMTAAPGFFRSPRYVKYEAVADLLRGRYRAFVYCETAGDVLRAQALGAEYGIAEVFVLGPDCAKAAEAVAAGKMNVILDPSLVRFDEDPEKKSVRRIEVARAFHEKGVAFALQSDPMRADTRSLFYQGMRAISQGLTREEALESVTLTPARILGMDATIGSLEPGKAANLVVLNGEPFELMTQNEFVMIDGKIAYDRRNDRKLGQLVDEKIDR